jgi:phage gp45-like
MPRAGADARIHHFGGASEPARIVAVHEGGRRLEVLAQGGELLRFELNAATARFLPEGDAQGTRLELLADAQGA